MTGSRWLGKRRRLLVFALVGVLATSALSFGLAGAGAPARPVHGAPAVGTGDAGVASDGQPSLSHAPVPHWLNLTPESGASEPPGTYGAASAYDPVDRDTVVFGGCTSSACPTDFTYTFAGGVWTNATLRSGGPPARVYASMDFDPNMGGVLLFGGYSGFGELNDTWLYAGGIWTNLTYVGPAPSARYGSGMAFDPEPEENGSVLFGGCVFGGFAIGCTNDTWIWQGWSGWTKMAPSVTPLQSGFVAMTFDPGSGSAVLYGGCGGPDCGTDEPGTWELADGQWSEVGTSSAPPLSTWSVAAYEPLTGQVLLFGGRSASGADLADTWGFEQGQWRNLTPADSPTAREGACETLDPTGTTVLLFGGEDANRPLNDTWAFEKSPLLNVTLLSNATETGAPVSWTVNVSGGTPPYSLAVGFGDGTTTVLTGPGPLFQGSHTFVFPGAYATQVNLTDSLGVPGVGTAGPVSVVAGPVISVSAVPGPTDVGLADVLTATWLSGGEGPLSYAWSFGDGTSGANSTVSHAYSSPGTYSVNVTGTDLLGGTATASTTVAVATAPTVSISFAPAAPNASALTVFQATLTGGTGPFEYYWTFGDGSSSSLPTPTHVYSGAGTYAVHLTVNDSVGGRAVASSTVIVAGTHSYPSGSGLTGLPIWFWGAVAALVVVAIVGTWALRRRRPPAA